MKSLSRPTDKADVIWRLAQLSSGASRRWGRMTAHQAVCHLNDSFRAVMGDREVTPAGTLVSRTVVRFVALHTPLAWPKGVPTRPEVDQEAGGTKPVEFMEDLATLQALVERFTATPRDFEFHPHPVMGPLSEREWMHWGYRHLDHHLRQFGV